MKSAQVFLLILGLLRGFALGLLMALAMLLVFALGAALGLLVRLFCLPTDLLAALRRRAG